MQIGQRVKTPQGKGIINWISDYSKGRYYDVRLDTGQLIKFFHNQVTATE